jgi:hypothetical protein
LLEFAAVLIRPLAPDFSVCWNLQTALNYRPLAPVFCLLEFAAALIRPLAPDFLSGKSGDASGLFFDIFQVKNIPKGPSVVHPTPPQINSKSEDNTSGLLERYLGPSMLLTNPPGQKKSQESSPTPP